MTTPLRKPVKRLVYIHGRGEYVVEISLAGVQLRQRGRRFVVAAPWTDVLGRAERLAGEEARRARVRA